MKKTFVNELGNQVTFEINWDTGGKDTVVLSAIGPNSESEWIVTDKEAEVIYGLLATKYSKGAPK